MSALTWDQVDISDETEELVKASTAPSTIEDVSARHATVGNLVGWTFSER